MATLQQATADEIPNLVAQIGSENFINIIVYDELGNLTHNHTSFNPLMHEHIRSIQFSFTEGVTGASYSMYALASLAGVRQVGVIMDSILPFAFVVSLLISLGLAFVQSRWLAKPIVSLSEMSKKMSDINLKARCDINRDDEIGLLGSNLNHMAEKLEKTFETLQVTLFRERQQEKQRSDLFAAISHELKTPITILKGEIGGMIDNIGVYKDRETYLKNAFKTTEQMEDLVKEILNVFRLENQEFQLNMQKIALNELIADICEKYGGLADSAGIVVKSDFDEDLFLMADGLQLQKAISNIINNAITHSPAGTTVNVELKKSDGFGVLTVENAGHINEADLGSGLGLYIVKQILQRHKFPFCINCQNGKVIFTIKFILGEIIC